MNTVELWTKDLVFFCRGFTNYYLVGSAEPLILALIPRVHIDSDALELNLCSVTVITIMVYKYKLQR